MQFDITNWSPNYISTLPYHLQLKDILLKAIEDGRFEDNTILPQPKKVGVSSVFQKEYALKAYDLLVKEGTLMYVNGLGYFLKKSMICNP